MSPAEPVWFEFIETVVFTRRLAELASQDTLAAIQSELIEAPERWPVVRGTGGARKGRVADPKDSRGKSGGYRYLYLYLPRAGLIYLLYIFGKNEQGTLTPAQKMMLARLGARIREELE